MTQLIALIFLFSMNAFAQNQTPFDMIEASRLANEAAKKMQRFNSQMGVSAPTKCETVHGANGEAVATCSIKEEDFNTPIVKIDYDVNEIPAEIKAELPDQFVKDTQGKKISCVYRFKLSNDNQQMVGRISEGSRLQQNIYGDDAGRTHGLDVGVNCASADGISNAFTYSTEMYSDPNKYTEQKLADGNYRMKQKFTSENIFAILQDNINQGKATYWKRGVGFINLSEKKKWGLLQSTGQQEWWHGVVNKVKPGTAMQYEYEEGSKDKWGAFVTLAVGFQENAKLGKNCTIKFNADLGVRASTLPGTSTVNANAQAEVAYQVTTDKQMYLQVKSETTFRSDSRITENTVSVGVRTKSGSFAEFCAMSQRGNRRDVHDSTNFYTGKNDLQVCVRFGVRF